MSNLQPCGTDAAYRRHLKAHETPCDACREARSVYVATRSNDKVAGKAVSRAQRALARRHPDEYRAILDAERDQLGLPPVGMIGQADADADVRAWVAQALDGAA